MGKGSLGMIQFGGDRTVLQDSILSLSRLAQAAHSLLQKIDNRNELANSNVKFKLNNVLEVNIHNSTLSIWVDDIPQDRCSVHS